MVYYTIKTPSSICYMFNFRGCPVKFQFQIPPAFWILPEKGSKMYHGQLESKRVRNAKETTRF